MSRRFPTLITAAALLLSAAASAVEVGRPAPDFTLPSATGANLRLSEQLGQVVMINFWASWCGPCRQEMPMLGALADEYGELGFQLFGVNLDANPAAAQKLMRELGVDYPLLLDRNNRVADLYSVSAMPATVLVDKDGLVSQVFLGYRPEYDQKYADAVRELLRAP